MSEGNPCVVRRLGAIHRRTLDLKGNQIKTPLRLAERQDSVDAIDLVLEIVELMNA